MQPKIENVQRQHRDNDVKKMELQMLKTKFEKQNESADDNLQ